MSALSMKPSPGHKFCCGKCMIEYLQMRADIYRPILEGTILDEHGRKRTTPAVVVLDEMTDEGCTTKLSFAVHRHGVLSGDVMQDWVVALESRPFGDVAVKGIG